MPTLAQTYILTGKGPFIRPVIIDNTQNSNALSNYQIGMTLDTASLISAGKMRSDCGDIRFYDSDWVTPLSYWVEGPCNSASTRIWVKVPSIPASSKKTIYLYYGNSALTSLSNPKNVFLFFEDFENSRDSHWVDGPGTSGQYEYATPALWTGSYRLHFKTGRSTGQFYNMWWEGATFSNFRFIAYLRADYSDDDSRIIFRATGSTAGSSYNPVGYNAVLPRAGNQNFILSVINTSGTGTTLASYSAANTSDTVRFEITVYGTSISVRIERPPGTYITTLSATDSTFSSGYIGLAAPGWDSNRNPSFDTFAVGQYTSPEPTVTIGTETSISRYPDSM
jgi:hypothetical protein